jgi:hypothetical protein
VSAAVGAIRRWFRETPAIDAAVSFCSRGISAARAEGRGAKRALQSVAIEPIPGGAFQPRIDHPGFVEPEALREALRRVLQRAEIRLGAHVAAIVPDALVRYRLYAPDEAPPLAPDRDEQLRFRLRRLLPPDAGEPRMVAAWAPGAAGTSSDARGALGIGGVAAVLDAYENALRAFGLDCGSIEPALTPLLDALGRERPEGDAIVVLHDASSASVAVLRDGWPVALRSFGADVASSPDEMTAEIATTAVFWRERLAGRSLGAARVHAADPDVPGIAAAIRASFAVEPSRAGCPAALVATGIPEAILRTAAPALALLARG